MKLKELELYRVLGLFHERESLEITAEIYDFDNGLVDSIKVFEGLNKNFSQEKAEFLESLGYIVTEIRFDYNKEMQNIIVTKDI